MWTLRDLVHKILQYVEAPQESTSINKQLSLLLLSELLWIARLIKRSSGTTSFQVAIYSVSFNNVCDLIDFSNEAVNCKFQNHRLKLDGCGILEPFNYLVSQKEKKSISRFVDFF